MCVYLAPCTVCQHDRGLGLRGFLRGFLRMFLRKFFSKWNVTRESHGTYTNNHNHNKYRYKWIPINMLWILHLMFVYTNSFTHSLRHYTWCLSTCTHRLGCSLIWRMYISKLQHLDWNHLVYKHQVQVSYASKQIEQRTYGNAHPLHQG